MSEDIIEFEFWFLYCMYWFMEYKYFLWLSFFKFILIKLNRILFLFFVLIMILRMGLKKFKFLFIIELRDIVFKKKVNVVFCFWFKEIFFERYW